MGELLKRAFWLTVPVPGLGRLPVNLLGLVAFAILGFGHPSFWLLGAGLEVGYLAALSSNPRFQRAVRAQLRSAGTAEAQENRLELIRRLDPEARRRLALLEEKCVRALERSRDARDGDFALESSREGLDRLQWIYLKLLVARHHLEGSRVSASEEGLKRQIAALESSLESARSRQLRSSQEATLKILRQRLSNLEHCEQTLNEVDSDLARIEAQVDLALESAAMRRGGAAVTANLELASQILEDGLYFGESESAVEALDQAYSTPPRLPEAPRRG